MTPQEWAQVNITQLEYQLQLKKQGLTDKQVNDAMVTKYLTYYDEPEKALAIWKSELAKLSPESATATTTNTDTSASKTISNTPVTSIINGGGSGSKLKYLVIGILIIAVVVIIYKSK